MKLSEKMSYLKGLAAGLRIDITTNEGRILSEMMEVLETAVMYIDDLQNQVDELTELCEDLDSDLGDVDEFLLDEDDEDYDFDEEEDLYETVCPTCENTIVLADSILDEGSMKCPCCGELLEFDFDDLSIEDFESKESEDEE